MANKAIPSRTETELTDATNLYTSSPKHEAKDHDSHASTQQPFRFINLPRELRGIIYGFAMAHGTINHRTRGEIPDGPQLTAGLSESVTARALSQVCRTVRQESMELYYTKTTFIVRNLPNPTRIDSNALSVIPGSKRKPDPLKLWTRTWGVRGAQHIRSLRIESLGYLRGVVRISATDKDTSVSLDNGSRSSLSASALNAARLEAFVTSAQGETAARKLEDFIYELGRAFYTEQERCPREWLPRRRRP